ncbi:hypothetical protein BKA67DRAFT_188569 [Truncatella angustata]|uniref:Uncharacterized protein n=1 Tax=Truncatella angustata TaxID=152316 RepID=A0A9P8US95_9PEZI|nr:uncharacterized protein BKA67DRAFT_188569 [Truncatella angustata]KAH6657419.1 hypothetical protein BKA67DRAFT_188569 [Truncatella angustata]
MLSRSNSISSIRSVRSVRGAGKSKITTYACKHELTASRLNTAMAGFPIEVKTRKCPDCQTMTPDGALILLEAIRKRSSATLQKADDATKRKLAECLFERLADRRRGLLKEDWDEISLSWATFCYLHVPIAELKNVCATIKTRYGAGVDKQTLQTLGRAACVEENVWEAFEPRDTPMFSTANHVVADLRIRHGQIDRFGHVEDIFFAAKELGVLCDTTVVVYNKVSQRLNRWGAAHK